MTRRLSFWFSLSLLLTAFLAASTVLAAQPVSVETYRAQLQRAEIRLRAMEARAPRKLAPILNSLAQDKTVKRADGQTQTASGDEFGRLSKELAAGATREQTQAVRERISIRIKSLDDWSQSTLTPADAQAIIRQLEGSGQIRTGPTRVQQLMADVSRWITQTLKDLMNWIAGLFPTAQPGKAPQIDTAWVQAIFTATVLALLAVIGFLVWRAVGGKIGRKRRQPGAFAFSPEDAELLLLPPDELRERARRFAGEGNFREALRHLYIALLLNLDARGVWRYDARRTNWEHIAVLKVDTTRSTLIAPLSDITRRFDRVRYGNAPCEQNDWADFERDVTALEARTSV